MEQHEITELIKKVRSTPGANNKPVLGVNVIAAQRSQNGGYPKHLYHQKLDPIIALSQDEQDALSGAGYVEYYIPRDYPKHLYRRNMDVKFKSHDFVEERVVKSAAAEAEAVKTKPRPGQGPWVAKVTDIEALPDEPTEDPKVTIARLEGALKAAQEAAAAARK